MTEAEVRAKLNSWLAGVVGQQMVISARPDAPRPGKPYVMTNLMLSGPVHPDAIVDEFTVADEGTEDEQISQHPVQDWFWRFSVHAYGDDPSGTLRKVRVAFQVLTAREPLYPLTVHSVSDVRDVPELVENEWEPRANVDIELRGIVRDGVEIDVIEETSFTAERV